MDGDGERFAKNFAAVWRRVPTADKRRMRRFWSGLAGASHRPMIILTAYESDFAPGGGNSTGKPIAHTSLDGHRLMFDATRMDKTFDVAVQSIIAHELAHACLIARSASHLADCRDVHATGEKAADALAESWGFYQPELHKKRGYMTYKRAAKSRQRLVTERKGGGR